MGFIVSEQKYRNNLTKDSNRIRFLNRWCIIAVSVFSFFASIRPSLVTELAFNAFAGMLQLAPVMFAGIYGLRITNACAFCSVFGGLIIVVLGNTPLYTKLPFSTIPHYFVGFILAVFILCLGRLLYRRPA